MEHTHGFDSDRSAEERLIEDATEAAVEDAMFNLGGDERRMHVRAYNHWVSLLKGQPFPLIADLDPASIADFGPHSVLLDFSGGELEDPRIPFLGRALRDECDLGGTVAARISDVPSRSLLSRLTDHYLQIIANRAPIGFEAEFVGTRGHTTLYRGILMPFSSDGEGIDYIYGVINWKELVDPITQAGLDAELDAAVRGAPTPGAAPIWADGPSGGFDAGEDATPEAEPGDVDSLADRLAMARESAAAVRAADTRSRAALYRALGRAHDFALAAERDPDDYAELLGDAGIKPQARAPMTPVVKLVFGADYDKTRLTEFATVLSHARRHGVPAGELASFVERQPGGIKGVVAAERAERKPPVPRPARTRISDRPSLGHVAIATGGESGSLVVLLARVADNGLDIVGTLADPSLTDRAVRALG